MNQEIINSFIQSIEKINPQEYVIKLRIPEDSPIFDGHFQSQKILAGAYQIMLCKYFLAKIESKNMIISKISKIRFYDIIKPQNDFQLCLNFKKKDTLYDLSAKVFLENKKIMTSNIQCQMD